MNAVLRYLMLPREMTAFEQQYLTRMNKVGLWFFVAHLPLFVLIALVNNTGPLSAAFMTLAVLTGPILASRACSLRTTSVVMGVTAMFMGGILVHIGQGPVQIEMHFYFFVLLALLAVFANPMVVVAAALTAALHHALLWLAVPASVFNYDAPIWVVAVHASFVVLESVAACYIARSFFDNVVGLEKIVASRTAEVFARNRDMRMLLDAVEQGFFTVDRAGVMSEERSAAVDRWLGTPAAGTTLAEHLRPHDATLADWMALGMDDVFAEFMPPEVTIDQLPKRLTVGDRTFKLEYTQINRDGALAALAVMISDISAQVARERLEAEHRMMMTMLERVTQDKAGFLEFVHEAEEIVSGLKNGRADDLNIVKRKVHTLKGNAGIFGMDLVAEACHAIEDEIAETGEIPAEPLWDHLRLRWRGVQENLERLVGEVSQGITVGDKEYSEMLADILNDEPREQLVWRVAAWRLEPTSERMTRVAEQARGLARRSGKGEITINTYGGELRIDREHWAPFWSAFVHVVRNAIDHGLESPEERESAGKSTTGSLELWTRIAGDRFVIGIRDDGRGINWDRVATLARERQLPADTRQQLVEALFFEGLSTSESVGELSGRGVGMAAVKAACLTMGGRVEVRSEAGRGTSVRFSFPLTEMSPSTMTMLTTHGIAKPERAFGFSAKRADSFEVATDSSSFGQLSALGI